ncbi:hypothetical protein [Streptomyces sp. NPDC050264]|uniref:hypothetical protein n=1 Tax=Streptomyces sp. NPDC050264 TaxID=3155038 RepID=UPI0034298AEE
MTLITDAEFEDAMALAPEAVRRYLSGAGWRAERDMSGGELWERAPDEQSGPPYEVLVPLRRCRDYAGRIADILETLAAAEARSPSNILREMRLPPVDWQFLRLMPPGPSGTAPLLDLVSALTGLKELHTAAGSSAIEPQSVQPGQKPREVKEHVASVRLDQTRVGSYVVAAHTPLRALSRQDIVRQVTLFDADSFSAGGSRPVEPFTRQVSRTLFAGVTCARTAADETLRRGSLTDFASYGGAGLSANLCEAMVRIAGEQRRAFSLSFAWSAEVPMEQASPPVTIAPRHVEALEAGAKDLRERLGREVGAVLHGFVIKLHTDGRDYREATIYGSFLHEDVGRSRRVRVSLRPEDVDAATRAWRNGQEIAVTGDTEGRGAGLRMSDVTAFVVRPE